MTILVTNWKNASVLHHSLVILKGQITSVDNGTLFVSVNGEQELSWAICQGLFCALVSLKTDENRILLRGGPDELEFKLSLQYLNRKRFVRLVYIVCSDSDGCFQGPRNEDCSIHSAKSRITFGARLIQSVTAEKIRYCGLSPKTFSLEEDCYGQIDCHVFGTKLSIADTHTKSEQELWEHFALELMTSELGDNCCKFLAFLSSTCYFGLASAPQSFSLVRSQTVGHVALGGGGLALLGTACLYTWANDLAEFTVRMEDSRSVDFTHFMDDSCNRGTLWGCYASSLGAALHELAHTFDQGHTAKGIMGLGFHQIQQELTAGQQKKCCVCCRNAEIDEMMFARIDESTNKACPTKIKSIQWRKPCPHCPDGPFWSPSAALLFFYHRCPNDFIRRWFLPEENDDALTYQVTHKGWIITSCQGLSVLEVRDSSGMVLCYWHPGNNLCPTALQVLKQTLPSASHVLVVQDTKGANLTIKLATESAMLTFGTTCIKS